MYRDECRKRRTDRVDRARKNVVLDPWAESVYQNFNDWLHSAAGDRTLTNLSRPPPLDLSVPHIVNTEPVPGTTQYRLVSFPDDETDGGWNLSETEFWYPGVGDQVASIMNMIRGQSGRERPLDRPLSWGSIQ